MLIFFRNLGRLYRFLYLVSKYQILTHSGDIKRTAGVKLLGLGAMLFTYPNGIFFRPKESFGRRLTDILKELGPIYIKFGQTLSTRPDLVGQEVADSLRLLQDKLPPFSLDIAKSAIKENLGQEVDEIFTKFNEKPIAAASIAQVHKARLKTGEYVAVKILRPDIHKLYEGDINFLRFLAGLARRFMPSTRRLRPEEVVNVFAVTMRYELDLKQEAAAASSLADNFKGDKTVQIPKIFWQHTNEEVLVTEWIDGVSIYNQKRIIELGLDPDTLAANIAVLFFNMAYRDGYFHADLHPGNILVKKDGTIALLDFGIMGLLPEKDRLGIAEILHALLKRDYHKVADIHLRLGYIPQDANTVLFAQSIRSIAEPIIGLAIKDISIGNLLARLFKVTEEYGMVIQPQLLMLQKTIVVVEGIGQSLDPDINMWALAEPWIKRWAAKNLSPEARLLRFLKKAICKLGDELNIHPE